MFFDILFFIFSLGMVLCLFLVFLSHNSVLSVISLIGFFLNGSGLLFFFQAEYLGIVYIVVYVGAIAVLFLFVVMMLDFKQGSSIYNYKTEYFLSSVFFLWLFFMYLINFFYKIFFITEGSHIENSSYIYKEWVSLIEAGSDILVLGHLLYGHYFLYLMFCGLLLLVAMMGAIILTLYKRENVRVQNLSDQGLRTVRTSVFVYKR